MSERSAGPWLDDARRLLDLLAAAGPDAPEQHAAECSWCPLCQALRLARQGGPDLLERVAETATAMAATLRSAQAPEHSGDDPTDQVPRPAPVTERIEIA